jgi:hypothetical protein
VRRFQEAKSAPAGARVFLTERSEVDSESRRSRRCLSRGRQQGWEPCRFSLRSFAVGVMDGPGGQFWIGAGLAAEVELVPRSRSR